MKRLILISLISLIYSCKDSKNIDSVNKRQRYTREKNGINHDGIKKIGNLYLPEKMSVKEISNEKIDIKEDYQITITNSSLLDNDIKNLENHANQIASIYYQNLLKNISDLKIKKIIVKIEHKNGKINHFEYSEEKIKSLPK